MTDPAPVRWDEDCLTLNIQTPGLDDAGRPVLVWIHGGGYRNGQGAVPWYNGGRFAANGDIVAVTINYRLGALGFTDLSRFGNEFETSGVNGILDQIAALEWVRDNIANFGGDPAKVTIAGESAGGFSVGTLLGSPRTTGLFRSVIAQSGAAHHVLPADAGQLVAERFLDALEASDVIGLEGASVDAILDAQTDVANALERGPGLAAEFGVAVSAFYPVVGSAVLPRPPSGRHPRRFACRGCRHGRFEPRRNHPVGLRRGRRRATAAHGRSVWRTRPPRHLPAQPAGRLRGSIDDRADHGSHVPHPGPSVWRKHAQQRAIPGFTNSTGGRRNQRLGATHALEIPFAFDNLHQPGVDVFIGEGPSPQRVASAMHGAWTNFIRDGDPGFPPYSLDQRQTMVFDDTSVVVADPDAEERVAWDGKR